MSNSLLQSKVLQEELDNALLFNTRTNKITICNIPSNNITEEILQLSKIEFKNTINSIQSQPLSPLYS